MYGNDLAEWPAVTQTVGQQRPHRPPWTNKDYQLLRHLVSCPDGHFPSGHETKGTQCSTSCLSCDFTPPLPPPLSTHNLCRFSLCTLICLRKSRRVLQGSSRSLKMTHPPPGSSPWARARNRRRLCPSSQNSRQITSALGYKTSWMAN